MQVHTISKKQFASLDKVPLPDNVFNTESQLFLVPIKKGWKKENYVLKKLYQNSGEYFSNKLYTINELIDKKDIINIDELIMPEKVVTLDDLVVGILLPYVPSLDLETVLNSPNFTVNQKVEYLKQVGEILEKIKKVREYTEVSDFYLNDIHENNFILNACTNKMNAVDLDSCKIGNNLVMGSRYLSSFNEINNVHKYPKVNYSVGGEFVVSEDTELYCYIIMILNFFYGENVSKMSIDKFYSYLEYLSSLGISKELLDKISYIYSGHPNENPYEHLEELVSFYGRTHKNTFKALLKRYANF